MRPGRRDAEADALRGVREILAVPNDLLGQLLDAAADLRPDFNDRLVHLALDLIFQRRRARRQQLGDVRPELPRGGIDDLELLLDADGEGVLHGVTCRVSSVWAVPAGTR